MILDEYFDKVYVITLPWHEERLHRVRKHLDPLTKKIEVFLSWRCCWKTRCWNWRCWAKGDLDPKTKTKKRSHSPKTRSLLKKTKTTKTTARCWIYCFPTLVLI